MSGGLLHDQADHEVEDGVVRVVREGGLLRPLFVVVREKGGRERVFVFSVEKRCQTTDEKVPKDGRRKGGGEEEN